MTDDLDMPFEKEIPKMTPKELLGFVYNWLWEGPLEYTPSVEQTQKLIQLIQTRPDAADCEKAVVSCQDYLRPLKPSAQTLPTAPEQLNIDS